jgi:hypothetical protein
MLNDTRVGFAAFMYFEFVDSCCYDPRSDVNCVQSESLRTLP